MEYGQRQVEITKMTDAFVESLVARETGGIFLTDSLIKQKYNNVVVVLQHISNSES